MRHTSTRVLLLCLVLLAPSCALRTARLAPLVAVGNAYVVIWEYVPIKIAERIIVTQIHPHSGWVYGHNPGDPTIWLINLNRAISVTPLRPVVTSPTIPRPEPNTYAHIL